MERPVVNAVARFTLLLFSNTTFGYQYNNLSCVHVLTLFGFAVFRAGLRTVDEMRYSLFPKTGYTQDNTIRWATLGMLSIRILD